MKPQLIRLFVLIIASCAFIVWSFNLIYSASDEAYGYSLDADALLKQGRLGFRELQPGSIAFAPELQTRLDSGEVISLTHQDGKEFYYLLLDNGHIREMGPVNPQAQHNQLNTLIPLLYASLALAILLLIGRVFKDLSLLQSQALSFGAHPKRIKIGIGHRSAIYPLAKSFETMTGQIVDFLELHRDLSRIMSHEIRTPLSRMRFVLELAKAQLSEKHSARLEEDINQIEALTKSYLSFARVEHQQPHQQREWVNAPEFINAVADNFAVYAPKYRVHCQVDCALSDDKVLIDPLSMDLASQNLIANALRFASGNIKLTLVAETRHWRLTVEDDGPGIQEPGKDLRQAFQRGSKQQSAGFGLGLYIVRKIAIWHQGKLTVENSAELGGASISLRWRRPLP
ncbi:HAMP domain-containing sensor histidine kinase [Shewanella amazonensis]|uniref:histidine kinase n=1 Tax=Shewanella amazonensis (strain ATCC BAA-1098 / SB2B) TaxID=326297 RepID=A1S383_SHEAM|nr:ATP-binding protein [Shewanella amazonensis]ABL98839.1 signal transduction histidine kinase-like protein [Shewanella amazonensis SB2B]